MSGENLCEGHLNPDMAFNERLLHATHAKNGVGVSTKILQ